MGSPPTDGRARRTLLLSYAQASLSDTERSAIVAQLSRFTGIPVSEVDGQTLTLTPRQFRTRLLADRKEILDTFDMRRTRSAGAAAAEDDEAAVAILKYLRRDLGYLTSLP